jgi:BlaI family penicillinase repressor
MTKAINLSRRERQIMDIVYELGEVTAQQVLEKLPEPPGYSAVRAMLSRLEEKGHLAHREQGARYLYFPLVKRDAATRSALSNLVKTFFDGSAAQANKYQPVIQTHQLCRVN